MNGISSYYDKGLLDWDLDQIPPLNIEPATETYPDYWSKVYSDFELIIGNRDEYSAQWQERIQMIEGLLKQRSNLEELITCIDKEWVYGASLEYLPSFLKAVQAELYESEPQKARYFISLALKDLRKMEPCSLNVQIDNKLSCLMARIQFRRQASRSKKLGM